MLRPHIERHLWRVKQGLLCCGDFYLMHDPVLSPSRRGLGWGFVGSPYMFKSCREAQHHGKKNLESQTCYASHPHSGPLPWGEGESLRRGVRSLIRQITTRHREWFVN